jgi:hypothetical protein
MSNFLTCHVMVLTQKLVYVVYAAVKILLYLQSSVMLKIWGQNQKPTGTVNYLLGGDNLSIASSSQTTTVYTVQSPLLILGPYKQPWP